MVDQETLRPADGTFPAIRGTKTTKVPPVDIYTCHGAQISPNVARVERYHENELNKCT